jgi:hypothetical protein
MTDLDADATGRVLDEVLQERMRQVALGWTPSHDDEHGTGHIAGLIQHRLGPDGPASAGQAFLEIAALAVAGLESIDRKDAQRA